MRGEGAGWRVRDEGGEGHGKGERVTQGVVASGNERGIPIIHIEKTKQVGPDCI